MQTRLLLALARPSTASTADAADLDLDVPSIAKEVARILTSKDYYIMSSLFNRIPFYSERTAMIRLALST
jgi:hypothetical protein